MRLEILQRLGGLGDQLVKLGQYPAVQLGAFSYGRGWRFGVELVNFGVGDEERIDVPQGDYELTPHLVRRAVAEIDVGGRVVTGEHPAHGVNAHLLGGVLEPDCGACAFVHLLALLVSHQGVAEHRLEAGCFF